jgi:diguanylate cyclase (GGDEF)-like protein/putative nucleotidyltransferase with HDIG domain
MPKKLHAGGLFSSAVVALGLAVALASLVGLRGEGSLRAANWALLALVTTGLQIRGKRAGAYGVSPNFIFVLLSILQLSFSETVLLAGATTAIHLAILIHRGSYGERPGSTLFQVASSMVAAAIGYQVFHSAWMSEGGLNVFPKLIGTASMLFAGHTFPLAVMQAVNAKAPLAKAWRELSLWSFPLYLSGAVVAGIVDLGMGYMGNATSLALLLPAAFAFYFASHFYMGRLSRQKMRLEQMADLHERTIEALALAIESKDQSAQEHLLRLRLYCVEMAKELGIEGLELDAIRAGALLHDIGKLAVPDHILSKNGKLTREEFEKIKIHPIVGAQILERVDFPYPVAQVVRHHHEKFDGSGYPKGLKGEAIPLGARILALVDTFDAMIEGRQYRTGIPVKDAIKHIVGESGKAFDPKLVHILVRNYISWEGKLRQPAALAGQPAALGDRADFCDAILAAGREERVMLDLTRQVGNSLLLEEAMSALFKGLTALIGFEAVALYVPTEDDKLEARYVQGALSASIRSKQIPFGQGVVGWVAQHERPVINGTPAEEMGAAPNAPESVLRAVGSAMAIPLRGRQSFAGVLMLCSKRKNSFTTDHLRILQMLTPKLASVVENARNFEQAASSASTDFLTGLPNARSLSLHLDAEISRAHREGVSLSILVTDLDGFKMVNDVFGHLEGNKVLCAVAASLRESCREYDYVARLGGDEFVIVLPGLKGPDLQSRIDLFDRVVRDASGAVCPQAPVGLSAGIAQFPRDGGDAATLLANADAKMYQAKTLRKRRGVASSARGFAFDTEAPVR